MKKALIIISAILVIILCAVCVPYVANEGYTVTFLDQQGTVIQESVYKEGETLDIPQDPSVEGHTFAGWALDGSSDIYDFDKDGAKTVNMDLRFIAQFAPNSYTVKFIAANGTDVISQETYIYGENMQVPEAPTREGYDFVGWMKQGEQNIYDFNADGAVTVRSDTTFVAQYDAYRVNVVFADHDGSIYKEQTYLFGEYFTVPEAPEHDGYMFKGWALSGEAELYDFEKENAKLVGDQDITFVAIYDKLEIVTGYVYKVNGTAVPQQITILFGEIEQQVVVDRNGAFTTQLPEGEYTVSVKLDGYRSVYGRIAVKPGKNSMGSIKLLQTLTSDMAWWSGGKLVQSGASATIGISSDAHADAGHEFKIGQAFAGATSWKVSAHISEGAIDRRGFSFGTTRGGNAPLFMYIDGDVAGFYTWGTYKNAQGEDQSNEWVLSDEVKAMIQSDKGYELTLTATNIQGAGTGWLTLYVNDVVVARLENTFLSVAGPHIQENIKLDLSAGHIALAVRGPSATTTFTDYYYNVNTVSALKMGTVAGNLVKFDGTQMPNSVVFDFGEFKKNVTINADGSFEADVPVGDYELVINGISQQVCVDEGIVDIGTIKLLQPLTSDMGWWQGANLSFNGDSASIQIAADANGDAGHEFRVGEYINDATSWKISTHVAAGARGRHGLSVGTTGANGTVFFFLDGDRAGYYTWWTYMDESIKTEKAWDLPEEAKAAIASENGYDLSLVATNINGEGNGWLTWYVNDIAVIQMENVFVGGSSPHVAEGAKLNLSKVHLSLAVRGNNTTVTYSDYYYTVNSETDLVVGNVAGNLIKLDGTKLPATVVLTSGTVNEIVQVDSEGKFNCVLPEGSYQLIAEGYHSAIGAIDVKAGNNHVGEIKLLQSLTKDMEWWSGSTLTVDSNTADISIAGTASGDAGYEARIGEYINDATSWKVSAHVAAGARGRHGLSVGTTGANGTVFFFLDGNRVGYYTWGTYLNEAGAGEKTWEMPETAKAAIASADGYDLSLVATNVNGEATGWLTLYVNDTAVLQVENKFIGGGGPHVGQGAKLNLSKVHLCLTVRGNNSTASYSDYYYTVNSETNLALSVVSGSVVKLDGSSAPSSFEFVGEVFRKAVTVNSDGTFTTQIPAGEYALDLTAEGYRATVNSITVTAGENHIGEIKLLQKLTSDMGWWQGGVLTEESNFANISIAGDANGDAGHEFRVGEYINNATSWRISAHVEAGARGRHGFSVGTTGANGTVFFFLDGNRVGYYTWWTYLNPNGGTEETWALTEDAKNAIASANGYDLSLVATNINGEGTGWLTLYVNDIAVVQIPNEFVGGGGPHVGEGAKLNLSKVHLSLTVRGNNSTANYSDYYYTINSEAVLKSTVSGSVIKLDGSKLPAEFELVNGEFTQKVTVSGDGTFTTEIPMGEYIVNLNVEGYRLANNMLTVTNGENINVQIKLLQKLTSDMGWWQGGALTEEGNSANISIAGDANGDAGHEFRVGEYINNATSWRISAHVEAGARGRHGFSTGTTGANGTVFFFLDGNRAGYYTWWTYLNPKGATEETWELPEAAKKAIASANGYNLSLVGTNVNGEGTGWLTLYVNDIAVVQIPNEFVGGGGPHVGEGAKLNLSKAHLSLTVRGNNSTATYSDYYYTVNSEAELVILPTLAKDMEWWSGSTLVQDSTSATISIASDANGDAGYEARVGEYINNATSWKISAHVAAGATGRHGLSVGTTGANGTVFFFLDGNRAGYYTWWTYLNPNGGTEQTWELPYAAKAAIASADGYDLSLVATDINGEGTGWLSLYVNNIEVIKIPNDFVGGGGPHVSEGAKLDLSKAHLSLAVRGNNSTATYSKYGYTVNSVAAVALPSITKDMEWWSGSALTQGSNSTTISIAADANGDAGYEARVGEYINNATSWKISTHVAAGARGRHGLSVGTTGANGTVFFFLDGNRAGYYTWWTYLNPNGGTEETWELPDPAKTAIQSDDGYYLSLVATEVNGEGTGTLVLYVNEIAVVQIENVFIGGGGPHVGEGAKLNLSKVHLSLAVRGSNSTATFSKYFVVA